MAARYNPVIFETPLSDAAHRFLVWLRVAGGRVVLYRENDRTWAESCRRVGFVHVSEDGKVARLTGLGQSYLDRSKGQR